MNIKQVLIGFFTILFFHASNAQTRFDFDLSRNCSYYGERIEGEIYGFDSSQEATNAIASLLRQVGLRQNFEIRAANVPNAAAVINGSTRYILYSQNFITRINSSTNSRWAAISILAHEIGHHLNGHTLENTGSRPPIELEADEFSGFVLGKMGASLAEAQLAMNAFSDASGSSTHPPRRARLEAIAVGWNSATESLTGERGSSTSGSTTSNRETTPPTIPSTTTTTVRYVSRCVFPNDPHHYYITNTNVIVGVNPFNNQSMIVGQKQPSNDSRFAWLYVTSSGNYGVDSSGRILTINNLGQLLQVGHVINL